MNWVLSEQSKKFLEENLPDIFAAQSLDKALRMLYDLIDEKGFAPPSFEDYNDFGRRAQSAYDDLYQNND